MKVKIFVNRNLIVQLIFIIMLTRGLNFFRHGFSTMIDPYYILGVERSTDFAQIKKAYYKMASQYHPDKNDTPEANKKFVLIKQAFEAIKMQKGLMKPQHFYPSDEKSSMRPNPSQFYTDQQQQAHTNTDYKVESQKAQASGQQYQRFNTSFRTIHDINQIKIKVEKGQMKDASSRFNLEEFRVKIKTMSNDRISYIFYIGFGLLIFFFGVNSFYSSINKIEKEKALLQMSKIHKRKTIETQTEQYQRIQLQLFERTGDVKKMQQQEMNRKIARGQHVFVKDKVLDFDQVQKV